LGLIGQFIFRTFEIARERPLYIIKRIIWNSHLGLYNSSKRYQFIRLNSLKTRNFLRLWNWSKL
jgi:hypothetical protein